MRNKAFVLLVILSFLFATTPQQGLSYLIEHQQTFKFKSFVFTDKGIEMEVPTEALAAVYTEKEKIGYKKAVVEKSGQLWKVTLIFEDDSPPPSVKEEKVEKKQQEPKKAPVLSPQEQKTVELLRKTRKDKEPKKTRAPKEPKDSRNPDPAPSLKTQLQPEPQKKAPASSSTPQTVKWIYRKGKEATPPLKNSPSSRPLSVSGPSSVSAEKTFTAAKNTVASAAKKQAKEKTKNPEKKSIELPFKYSLLSKEAQKELLKPVSLSLKGVPPIAFLDLLSEKTGLSVVPVGQIPEKPVTLFIDNIPLYKAVEIFLAQTGLGLIVDSENVVIVGTVDEIARIRQTRETLSVLDAGTPVIKTLELGNAKAKDLEARLKDIFGKFLIIRAFEKRNLLILKGPRGIVAQAEKVIETLDQSKPQIFIQAKIIEVSENAMKDLGIRWAVNGVSPAGLNGLPATVSTTPGFQPGPPTQTRDSVRIQPSLTPYLAQSLKIGFPHDILSFETTLYGLVQKGKARILSQPQVTVEDGEEGKMSQTEDIPYTVTNNFIANVAFKSAGILLRVTPHIIDKEKKIIKLNIHVERSSPDYAHEIAGLPPITRQLVATVSAIKSGDYAILGGLKVKKSEKNKKGVPILSSIPILKYLFSGKSSRSETYDFLVVLKAQLLEKRKEVKT